jgi:hypothetical protein
LEAQLSTYTSAILRDVIEADEDFEWYPTTEKMIQVVAKHIPSDLVKSIMDIGAGDGRVLTGLRQILNNDAIKLYAIEKSKVLSDTRRKKPSDTSVPTVN